MEQRCKALLKEAQEKRAAEAKEQRQSEADAPSGRRAAPGGRERQLETADAGRKGESCAPSTRQR